MEGLRSVRKALVVSDELDHLKQTHKVVKLVYAEAPTPADIQALLANRFRMSCHREEKVLPVLALLIGKNGPKFKQSEGEGESGFETGKSGKLSGSAVRTSMPQVADLLSRWMRAPVLDQTGLRGRYDFHVDLAGYVASDSQIAEVKTDPSAIIAAVLQEQLGLKLQPRKMPVPMLVIDRAEKPAEN